MKKNLIWCFIIAMALGAAITWYGTAANPTDPTFSVATYNIRMKNDNDAQAGNGWDRRAPYVARLIQFHGFDIFGTQEGFKEQLDDLKREMPGYDYIGVGREDGKELGEHSAIFYRTDLFEVVDHGDFWLSETPEKPGLGWDAACVRICTWGKFKHIASGREFLFFNLHMDHIGKVARIESAKLIKNKIIEFGSDLPTFLTGDFNVAQGSPAYGTIIDGGMLRDAHDAADFVYQLNGTFNSYNTDGFSDERIDHIFVSQNVHVLKYGMLTDTYRTAEADTATIEAKDAPTELKISKFKARTPSDHFPVKTIIELK